LQFNPAQRELTLKVVYYGPALSGKTTNLRALYSGCDAGARGRLMTLDTADDRTLFFDLLPLFLKTSTGVKVKIKLFTVPGQVMHNSTRRIVLSGADAVAFIADAQPSARQANFDYWRNMSENLRENAMSVEELPIVIQFNKWDLADAAMRREIEEMRRTSREPIQLATAIRGEGVMETFTTLLTLAYDRLDGQHDLQGRVGMQREDFLKELSRTFVPANAGLVMAP
jgi:signal recognition particle receptor subunit beta